MIADRLHIFLLTQRLAANLLAPVRHRHHALEHVVNQIELAVPCQRDCVANAGAIHKLPAAKHFHQLLHHRHRQLHVFRVAANDQLIPPQRHMHIAFLLHHRHVLVIQAKERHIGIHGLHRQRHLFCLRQFGCFLLFFSPQACRRRDTSATPCGHAGQEASPRSRA